MNQINEMQRRYCEDKRMQQRDVHWNLKCIMMKLLEENVDKSA